MKIEAVKFSEPLAPVDELSKQHVSKGTTFEVVAIKHSKKFIFPYDLQEMRVPIVKFRNLQRICSEERQAYN
jgi:hypothetical protein